MVLSFTAYAGNWLDSPINNISHMFIRDNIRQNERHCQCSCSSDASDSTSSLTPISVCVPHFVSSTHPVILQACGQCSVGILCVCVCVCLTKACNYRRLRFLKVAWCPRWHGGQGTAIDHSLPHGHSALLHSSVTVAHLVDTHKLSFSGIQRNTNMCTMLLHSLSHTHTHTHALYLICLCVS